MPRKSRNAFYAPIINGDLEKVAKLLATGSNVNDPNPPPLIVAVIKQRAAIVDFLLEHGADLEIRDHEHCAALHLAAFHSDPEMATRLIAAGAQIDPRDTNQNTPLHFAASCGNCATIKALIAAGADRQAKNSWGHTPLKLADDMGWQSACEALSDLAIRQNDPHSFAKEENHRRRKNPRAR
jgi:uncharacterized protein